MSIGNNFWHWCRIPPEPPKNRHKKILASSLLCTILGVSIFAALAPFYGGLMVGGGSSFAVLSVANLGEGPSYIQNVTYQPVAEANNSTVPNYEETKQWFQDNKPGALSIGGEAVIGEIGRDDLSSINTTIINFGEKDLTATTIEIYRGADLFASIEGPFIVRAQSVGTVNFQVYNLKELSKTDAQKVIQFYSQQGESNETIFAGRVMYTITLKTSEGATASFDKFLFPTDYFSRVSL